MIKTLLDFIHGKSFLIGSATLATIPLSAVIAKLSPILSFVTLLFGASTAVVTFSVKVFHLYRRLSEWIKKRKAD